MASPEASPAVTDKETIRALVGQIHNQRKLIEKLHATLAFQRAVVADASLQFNQVHKKLTRLNRSLSKAMRLAQVPA